MIELQRRLCAVIVNTHTAPPPASAPNTVTFSATNEHNSVATLSCESGYTSSGDVTVACDATTDQAAWPTATAPTCTGTAPECGRAHALENLFTSLLMVAHGSVFV